MRILPCIVLTSLFSLFFHHKWTEVTRYLDKLVLLVGCCKGVFVDAVSREYNYRI